MPGADAVHHITSGLMHCNKYQPARDCFLAVLRLMTTYFAALFHAGHASHRLDQFRFSCHQLVVYEHEFRHQRLFEKQQLFNVERFGIILDELFFYSTKP